MYFRMTEGKRERWTITMPAIKMLGSCKKRVDYHNGRVAFWQEQLSMAESKLRKEGLQFTSYAVTGGERTEAKLDPGLAARVQECRQRLSSNQDSANRFAAFHAFFKLAGSKDLELSADDVLYFDLEGADVSGDGEE